MLSSKKLSGLIAVLLAVSMLLGTGCGAVTSDREMPPISDKTEPKAYSTATVDDDFIDNQVLVVMQPNASHLRYGRADFKEVRCKKVWTLTDDYYIEKGANKALILTLRGHSKQNVIDAVKVLEQREDVLLAEPAREGTFAESRIIDETSEDSSKNYIEQLYFVYKKPPEDAIYDNQIVFGVQPHAISKEYTAEDFAYVGCIEIENDRYFEGANKRFLRFAVESSSPEEIMRIIRILEQRDDAYSVEPHIMEFSECATPFDTYTNQQWAIDQIQLNDAWNITTGSDSIKVGILDGGIDRTHPDLVGQINENLCASFIAGQTPWDDTTGHGTAVASIIGAATNNGIGISGVCWDIQLVALKVTYNGFINEDALIDAIEYAHENGIKVLNCSQGEASMGNDVKTAIDAYFGVFVCAAGNHGKNIGDVDNAVFPACFNIDNKITVGACEIEINDDDDVVDIVRPTSNWGSPVDLFAPGGNINVCYPTAKCVYCDQSTSAADDETFHRANGYHKGSGTSFASPYVAGVVALMLSVHPNMTSPEVKRVIKSAVDESDPFENACTSEGRLNAYNAVLAEAHYNYTYISATKHRKFCGCGESIQENHKFSTTGATRICSDCGYQVQLQNVEPEYEIE